MSGSVAAAIAPTLGHQHRLVRRLTKLARGLRASDRMARHLAVADWSSPADRDLLMGARDEGALAKLVGFGHYAELFRGSGDLNFHSHLLINTFLAAHNFLYTDKASMAASLEVRVPFMDIDLLRLAARIPENVKLRGRETKYVLKKAMGPLLPPEIIHRSKTGFGVPLRRWMRKDLKVTIDAVLSPDAIRRRGLFNQRAVAQILAQNDAGEADHAYLIYALLTLEIWMQTFIDRRAVYLAT